MLVDLTTPFTFGALTIFTHLEVVAGLCVAAIALLGVTAALRRASDGATKNDEEPMLSQVD